MKNTEMTPHPTSAQPAEFTDAEIIEWLEHGGPAGHDIFLDRDAGHFAIRLWPREGPGQEFVGQTFRDALALAMRDFPPSPDVGRLALGVAHPARPLCIIEAAAKETGPRFHGVPERWFEEPRWRCEKGQRIAPGCVLAWMPMPEPFKPNTVYEPQTR